MIIRWGVAAAALLATLTHGELASAEAGCTAGRATLGAATGQVFDLTEAADFLRVDPHELEIAAAEGEIPARQVLGNWRFSHAVLVVWMAGIDNPEDCFITAGETVNGEALGEWDLAGVTGAGMTGEPASTGASSNATEAVSDDDTRFGEQPVSETARDVALRNEEILLAAGEATIEPSLFYSTRDGDGVALLPFGGGFLPVESETEAKTLGGVLTGRYGLIDDVQLFAAASLLYEDRKFTTPGGSVSVDQVEFGDVGFGVRYGLMKEALGQPSVILTGQAVVPTNGTNGYGAGGGVALVKSVDPVALFASGDYLHTFDGDPNFAGEIQADDVIVGTMGYSLALNDSIAIGSALSGTFVRFDGAVDEWQESYSLRFSLTSLLDSGLYVEPSVAFRLNGDESSVLFGVTVPYTFVP